VPAPDSTVILTALRDAMLAAGLVRRGSAPGNLPPILVEPSGGAPAPHDRADAGDAAATRETDNDLVVTLRYAGDVTPAPGPSARTRVVIADLIYRSQGTTALKAGRALDAAVADLLAGPTTYGQGVQLPGLFVVQASVWAGLSPVSDVDGIRTERAAYALEAG